MAEEIYDETVAASQAEAVPSAEANPAPAPDSGVAAVEVETKKALDQGFVGEKVDPAPNEVYTIAGVTKNKP